MNVLFIQGGSRWKFDNQGNIYTDSNFNNKIWDRYKKNVDTLTVILRKEEKKYSKSEAENKYNYFDSNLYRSIAVIDIYSSFKNFFSIKKKNIIYKTIEEEVKKADRIVIRSLGNYYTNTALKLAEKYKKIYMVEVTGFIFESLWNHSIKGKVCSIYRDLEYRRLMKKVPYATYVTESALQKRYRCNGKSLSCSDVELEKQNNEDVLKLRLDRIEKNDKIVIGTAAFLDVKCKGQKYVIKLLAKLKKRGINNVEYQLVGAGNGMLLRKYAQKLGVENNLNIIGAIPHDKIFDWLDKIDIYIQPSLQEGLCRAIVEAMSRGCTVLASNVGGNYELIDKNFLFKKRSVIELEKRIIKVLNKEERKKIAKLNINNSKKYIKDYLDDRREKFYEKFLKERNVE